MRPRDVYVGLTKAQVLANVAGLGYKVVGFRRPVLEDLYLNAPRGRAVLKAYYPGQYTTPLLILEKL